MSIEIRESLRDWAATQDAPGRAAFNLLDNHGFWLRNRTFLDYCVSEDEGVYFIVWIDAQEHLYEGRLFGSSSEVAILRFALFLARDPLGLSSLDRVNRDNAVFRFGEALGVQQ